MYNNQKIEFLLLSSASTLSHSCIIFLNSSGYPCWQRHTLRNVRKHLILKRSEFYPDPNKPTCFPLFFLRFVQLLFFNNLLRFSQQWKNMGVKFGRLHQQPFELKLINANRALLEVQVIMFSSAADHSTESFFVYFAIVPIYLYIILMQTSFDQY